MVGPPDSKNPPDAPLDLPLQPEVDSLSTFVPEHDLERSDTVQPRAPAQEQPTPLDTIGPDTYIVWPVNEDDRSWWSRLRSLKASWEAKHLRRSAHGEPKATDANMPEIATRTGDVTLEAIRSLERHLASLAVLRDACASIDRRLARVEETSRHREHATRDEALHDVCSQLSDRLVRVEAAVQRTEDTLHSQQGMVAEWLQELSARMTARLLESEEAIQRIERERVDETLRLIQQALADSTLPEMCANIERQLVHARMELQRTQDAVADKTLHELCMNIDARLGRTEDALHRHEGLVTEWLQELSADMTARFAEAEEAIQHIERVVSSRTVEHIHSQSPSVRTDNHRVQAEETAITTSESREPADGNYLTGAALFLSRFVKIDHTNLPVRQPWMARLAVPALVLVAVLAIGVSIKTSRGVAPDTAVPITTSDQVSTPTEQATNQEIPGASTTAVTADASRSIRNSGVSTTQQPSPDRKAAPTTSRSPRFVGTLSITSVPSGASVSINGKPAGRTPLRLRRQRAGSLAVQVAHDGFERWSAAVLVPADQLTQVTATLRAAR
jgi:hypothetical protein